MQNKEQKETVGHSGGKVRLLQHSYLGYLPYIISKIETSLSDVNFFLHIWVCGTVDSISEKQWHCFGCSDSSIILVGVIMKITLLSNKGPFRRAYHKLFFPDLWDYFSFYKADPAPHIIFTLSRAYHWITSYSVTSSSKYSGGAVDHSIIILWWTTICGEASLLDLCKWRPCCSVVWSEFIWTTQKLTIFWML